MEIKELDTVVLNRAIPAHNLKQGDMGAVVATYPPDGIEVEFVAGAGLTQALVTLNIHDVRPVAPRDPESGPV